MLDSQENILEFQPFDYETSVLIETMSPKCLNLPSALPTHGLREVYKSKFLRGTDRLESERPEERGSHQYITMAIGPTALPILEARICVCNVQQNEVPLKKAKVKVS